MLQVLYLQFLSSIYFGTMGWFNDFAERGNISISQRVFYRFLIALIIIFIIIKIQKKSLKIDKRIIVKVSFESIVYFSFSSIFLTIAFNLIGPQIQSNAVGIILALLSAITFTLYVRMLDRLYCKSVDTFVLMFYVFLSSTLFWMIPSFVSAFNNTLPVDYKLVFISLFGLAIIGTLLSSSLFNIGVKMRGGRMTSILSVFEPVTSVLFGVILLNELITKHFGLDMILIIIGVVMVTLFENRKDEFVEQVEKIA